jgi:guanine deaminase
VTERVVYRAALAHCLADPGDGPESPQFECHADGALLIEDKRIVAAGRASDILPGIDARVVEFEGSIIVPGFIDCHVHFPQLDIIASFGEQLLDWLDRYAYPGEMRLADEDYARALATAFIDQLIANGTTSALVFATVHPHSADMLFDEALASELRLISGKVLMDRNAPRQLQDTAESAYTDSRALIERWQGRARLGYAITPRFALTSSPAELEAAGRLADEFPETWIHTHLAENHREIEEVAAAFPWAESYLAVYERFGLLRERAVFAHCLHLGDEDCRHMAEAGAAAAFCPTSNLFLGSGLYDLQRMSRAGVRTGLATDVGGGTTLSMLQTMGEAYKVLALQDQPLTAARALFLATLGAAEALDIDRYVGNFLPGKEADFVVLDPREAALSARRDARAETLEERLFALMILGDDRHVVATGVNGTLHRHG